MGAFPVTYIFVTFNFAVVFQAYGKIPRIVQGALSTSVHQLFVFALSFFLSLCVHVCTPVIFI